MPVTENHRERPQCPCLPAPPPRPQRAEITALLVILAIGVALRVLYVLALRSHPGFEAPAMDGGYHWAWARALARGEEFQDGPFFRAPLYPLWLSIWVRVLGEESTLAVRLVQPLLGGLSILTTWLVGRQTAWAVLRAGCQVRAGGQAWRVAPLVASACVALSWTLIAFDAELLIPTLLVPLLGLALWRFVAVLEGSKGGLGQVALAGVLFGLAAIARPNVLLFMPLAAAWLAHRRGLAAAAWLCAGTLLPIAPVTLHNIAEGDATLIATQGGVNLWIGNNPTSDGATAIVPGTRGGWWEGFYDARAQAQRAEREQRDPADGATLLKATEVSGHFIGRTIDWVREAPGAALGHLAWKTRLLWSATELGNNSDPRFKVQHQAPWLLYSPVRFGWLAVVGAIGLGLASRRAQAGRVLGLFTLVYSASVILFFVNTRFRLPLVPPLAIGTGIALVVLCLNLDRARRGRSLGFLALAIAGLIAVHRPLPGRRSGFVTGSVDLAKAELARGRPRVAADLLERALEREKSSVDARLALASVATSTGDGGRALRLLQEALALPGGDRPEVLARWLDARIDGGQAMAVAQEAEGALQGAPDQPALRFVYARALGAMGDAAGARRELRRVLEQEPTAAHAALALGQLELALGRVGAARTALERVLEMRDFAAPGTLARAAALLEDAARTGPGD